MPRVLRSLVALVSLVGLAGCTENAILEIEMTLPRDQGDPSNRRYAVVQVVDAASFPSFDEPWFVPTATFDLDDDGACEREPSTSSRCNVRFHAETTRQDVETLHVRVRFCADPACDEDSPDEPSEIRYRIERPFFRGRVTRWTPSVGPFVSPRGVPRTPDSQPAPGAPLTIDVCRCEIAGCWAGDPPPDEYGYCRAPDDGRAACVPGAPPLRHACE